MCHIIDNENPFDLEVTRGDVESDLSYMDLEEIKSTLDLLGLDYTTHYDIVTVKGYGQGDTAEVIILTDKLKEAWGVDNINLDELKEEITHFFYDTPMIARVTVNDEEYFIEDYDGCYGVDYSKEFIINYITNLIDYTHVENNLALRKELEKVIPCDISL